MARAVATSTRRGLDATKFTPIAVDAALDARPRLLDRGDAADLRPRGHVSASIFKSSLTFAITCGAWMGFVMYALAPSCERALPVLAASPRS